MLDRNHVSIDAAKSTGFAVGVPFTKPHCETWVLKGATRAERYVHLRAKMIAAFTRYQPAVCFIEEPLAARVLVNVGATIDTQLQLNGLVAVAEMVCELYDVRPVLVERQLVLGHFTGQQRYKGGQEAAKRACVARCHQLGYQIEGYDQADAAAQWDYGCAQLYRNVYATVNSALPLKQKGYDDAQFPGSRGFARRRKPRPKSGATLFD